ncbi:LPD7 domain-containing protein [Burkholderia sp. 4M9327F10]|uniref:LPD7 domain-containing protein n=1 Tax=Burkholderia sp. 4M9327F10 TaxID=2502223 RepID=UPI0010F4663C|nr:LPD7 domain-containing protein [Burkholderia sp. 4M9327F10]
MLIRVRGHHDGIKEYLEKGQKQDREFERDEMDERVILAGDLDLTNEIIQSMDTAAERYLTITLSFKEDEVSRETLEAITRDFEAFTFSAYRKDEYAFYAEAHVPRLKSYADRKSGEPIERKVHIHFVVPAVNLLTGRRLEPFGKVDQQTRFLEAFQEHANAKYGLASPKDNRRVAFTDASEMISRYKGDAFAGANRELKASILEAVLTRNITRHDDFRALLAEYGDTRTRNAGRDVEYENVKLNDAAKGVNLKEYVFSREFIELDADAKHAALASGIHSQYIEPGVPRETPAAYVELLDEWHAVRAREIKYLNSGSSFYETYRNASPDEQRRLLAHRETRFYQRTGGLDEREIKRRSSRGPGNWRDWWGLGRTRGHERTRESGRGGPERGQTSWEALEREHEEITRRWRAGADRDIDARFDRSGPAAESFDRVRGVPGSGLDGDAARRQMLLPPDALLELGNQQAERADALRWSGDREREGGLTGECDAPSWRSIAARMYTAYQLADPAERARLAATSAEKFERKTFGMNRALGGGRMPREFNQDRSPRSISDIQSFDAIASMPFGSVPLAAGRDRITLPGIDAFERPPYPFDAGDGLSDTYGQPPGTMEAPRNWPDAGRPAGQSFNARVSASTGREADTVLDQFARDLVETRSVRAERERAEFAEIRATLDASRLLAALAHSHGLIVEKYQVGKGRDGADRIKAGSRNLNVSDFLTKELNLAWTDAAQLLRDTYRAQTGRDPAHAPRRTPERDLWAEFQAWRAAYRDALRGEWTTQGRHETERRKVIKSAFYGKRSAIADRTDLSPAQRKDALSAARVERLEAEAALRDQVIRERDALKGAARRPLTDQYRDFLQERAQAGDARALRELRRMQRLRSELARSADEPRAVAFRPADAGEPNEIIYRGPSITYEVLVNGNVDYRKDGAALFVDEGRTLRLWDQERDALEIALRFAQQKFGSSLALTGPEAFQAAAARVAAETRMYVEFADPELERIRQIRRAELDAVADGRRAAQRDADRERDDHERERLRDIQRAPDPEPDAPDSEPEVADREDPDASDGPDAPERGPDIDR